MVGPHCVDFNTSQAPSACLPRARCRSTKGPELQQRLEQVALNQGCPARSGVGGFRQSWGTPFPGTRRSVGWQGVQRCPVFGAENGIRGGDRHGRRCLWVHLYYPRSGALSSLPAGLSADDLGVGRDDGWACAGANAMKLPEGWGVWLLVLGLNALAGALWFLDRGVEPPAPGGSLLNLLRSIGG